jgi:hypothetical protein
MPEPGERAVARAEETADGAPATDPSVDPIVEPVVEQHSSPAVPTLLRRAGPPAALLAAAWAAMVGLLVLTG